MPALTPHEQYLIEVGREIGKPRCETCADLTDNAPDDYDEIHCDNCLQNAAETAYERHCEDFHDGGCTRFNSLRDQQIEAMKVK